MKIILITHPSFLGGKKFNAFSSMPKYANMLLDGLTELGHTVQLLAPGSRLFDLPFPTKIKGLLGYADQYILFPRRLKRLVKKTPSDVLFVFTDHALGPWVPYVKDRPHVIHCHDFLAQRSALDEVENNRLGKFGKKYQQFIRRGYSQGQNFISISKKTQQELHRFVDPKQIKLSEVVYNYISDFWRKTQYNHAAKHVIDTLGENFRQGFILHIGGNQWYKNRIGLVKIYEAWRKSCEHRFPLLLIGEEPHPELKTLIQNSAFAADIFIQVNATDEFVRDAYSAATVFLFPSLAEGFGWPIAEAMACGCPVIIIDEEPMAEVAGGCAYLLPPYPANNEQIAGDWVQNAASVVEKAVNANAVERAEMIKCGVKNVERFSKQEIIRQIQAVYKSILQEPKQASL